jgi:hypothetical protein
MVGSRFNFESKFRSSEVEQLAYEKEPMRDVHKNYITVLRNIAIYEGPDRFLQDMKRRIFEPP